MCIICGMDNEYGLNAEFYNMEDNSVFTLFRYREQHQSYPSRVHGGLITAMLDELGFEIEEFGDSTLLLRQIPMDLQGEDAADALEALAADLLNGRREHTDTVRDALLHTVACKAAIKAGWHSDERELKAIAREVMGREELKYCPHGRPICVNLSKKALEKQFKRS